MFFISGTNLPPWVSVIKQESYLPYVRKDIKTTLFKNLMLKTLNSIISYNQIAAKQEIVI